MFEKFVWIVIRESWHDLNIGTHIKYDIRSVHMRV